MSHHSASQTTGQALGILGGDLQVPSDVSTTSAARSDTTTIQHDATSSALHALPQRHPLPNCPAKRTSDLPGCFDLYLFQYTWRPTFCQGQASLEECRELQRDPHAKLWGIHGLWPQYQQGWPQFCLNSPGCRAKSVCGLDDDKFDAGVKAAILRQMPAYSELADHEWRKHGTCTGLTQSDYWQEVLRVAQAVPLPEIMELDSDQSLPFEQVQAALGVPPAVLTCKPLGGKRQALKEVTTCWSLADDRRVGERIACPSDLFANQRCRNDRPIVVSRPAGHQGSVRDPSASSESSTGDTSTGMTVDSTAHDSGTTMPTQRCMAPDQGPACAHDSDCPPLGYTRCAKRSKCCTQPLKK